MDENCNFYEILEISSDASPQDVREAYIRTKSTYNRDSVALYTMVTPEEREEALQKIEEAYIILSNPDKRRKYDQSFGFIHPTEDKPSKEETRIPESAKIVSIDRVPPMESQPDVEKLLIPPKTDFQSPEPQIRQSPPQLSTFAKLLQKKTATPTPQLDSTLLSTIETETEWRGELLKKIREGYGISIEELAATTKITKTYLIAIEEENFPKLPAPVYVRGFVAQVAKALKLSADKVAAAYVARYRLSYND